jgi:hypothetical protein
MQGVVLLAATAAALLATAASAQNIGQPVKIDPNYKAPRIGADYAAAIAKLPDWNGRWRPWSRKPRPAEIAFDPENIHSPPDPALAEDEGAGLVGLIEGTYLSAIPYNKEWKQKYDKIVKDTMEGRSVDRVAICEPYGFPRVMGGHPSGPEIFMTPEVVVMYFDAGSAIRHIYTDGRKHPTKEGFDTDINPRWNGHSIGHWEGDTLVVDTVAPYPSNYDQTAAPHSDQLHVVERIRLVHNDWLEVAMTLTDPVAFTKPWQVTRYLRRATQKYPKVSDNTCSPDDFIDMSKGYQSIILPAEREAMEKAEREAAEKKK